MDSYCVPTGTGTAELVVKGSRFIGTVGPASSIEAAQQLVEDLRQRYPDATHHAWAYRLPGDPQETIGSSDDGEPGGTAGRPMLAVLTGEALFEAVVVGTRYFGGTKLGTGGLVRAYGAAARAAIEAAPIGEKRLHRLVALHVDYALLGPLRYEIDRHGAEIINAAYAADVRLEMAVPAATFGALATAASNLSSGGIVLEEQVVATQYLLRSSGPSR